MMRIIAACAALVIGLCAPAAEAGTEGRGSDGGFSYEGYAAVLERFVNDEGMVDYAGLKADSASLGDFLEAVGKLDRTEYEGWDDTSKIAFWINAYNALTLDAIIDHYPIKASFARSLIYPKNSIRQIPGVWDDLKWSVMGEKMTLNGIEHQTLRADFNEPRIHVALVCAAMGCPPLRNEPYVGERLDEQLDDQSRRFLSNPAKFRIDREDGTLHLSPIFKWFGEDFVQTYGTDDKFEWYGGEERAVVNFIAGYLSADDRDYLESTKPAIKYLDYDWSLNEERE